MRQCEEQKPMQCAASMFPVMACLRAERWKLLSWALQVQGCPKSFLISIKRRQPATRNSSSNRINIGTPRNNLLMGTEALKIILWLVNPKFSGKSSSWHNQEDVKVSIFLVNIKAIIPGFYSCWQFCTSPFFPPGLFSLYFYSGARVDVTNRVSHWLFADRPVEHPNVQGHGPQYGGHTEVSVYWVKPCVQQKETE